MPFILDQCLQMELTQIHQQWLGCCTDCGVARDVSNPVVMVGLCSAVFEYLMHKIRQHYQREETEKLIPQLEQDRSILQVWWCCIISNVASKIQ